LCMDSHKQAEQHRTKDDLGTLAFCKSLLSHNESALSKLCTYPLSKASKEAGINRYVILATQEEFKVK
jgi:hypothetical protein